MLTGVTTLAAVTALGACSGDGVTLPTVSRSGTVSVPSVSISIPSVTAPPSLDVPTLPDRTPDPTTEAPDPTTEAPEPTTEAPEPTPTPEPPRETVTATATATPEPAPTETVTQEPTPTETVTPTPSPSPSPTPTDLAQGEVADDAGTPAWLWWLLGAAALAALLAAVLVPRARRRAEWAADLASDEAEAAWFARELLPRLQTSATPDALAGGWSVAADRVMATEDRLTGLASTAPDDAGAARATQLRDAVRAARLGVEELVVARGEGSPAAPLALLTSQLEAVLAPPGPAGPGVPGGPGAPGGPPASGPA